MYRLNGRTAFGRNVLSNGTGTDAFLFVMIQTSTTSPAALLSAAGTSAHETGQCSFTFSGNPYEDFDRLGLDLQNCHIRFLRKPRNNGVAITGVFNISGTVFHCRRQGLCGDGRPRPGTLAGEKGLVQPASRRETDDLPPSVDRPAS